MYVLTSFGPETYIIIIVECSRIGMYKPFHHTFNEGSVYWQSWYLCTISTDLATFITGIYVMILTDQCLLFFSQNSLWYIASFHKPVNTFLIALSLHGILCPADFSILCTVYKLNQFVCQLQRLNVSNFSIKLATDTMMQSDGIPFCNKLVVSKSISHIKGSKLHTEHCGLQQSAPSPVSYSAPYSCTLPDCVPAV